MNLFWRSYWLSVIFFRRSQCPKALSARGGGSEICLTFHKNLIVCYITLPIHEVFFILSITNLLLFDRSGALVEEREGMDAAQRNGICSFISISCDWCTLLGKTHTKKCFVELRGGGGCTLTDGIVVTTFYLKNTHTF